MSPLGWFLSNLTGILLRNLNTQTHQGVSAQGKAHVRTQRRWSSARWGEKPQEEPNLLTASSWTSSLQPEKINLCCLSPSFCDILLCQPFKTKAYGDWGTHAPSSRWCCQALGPLGPPVLVGRWEATQWRIVHGRFLCSRLGGGTTCTHILLAKSHSHGHTQLQGRLGNIV